MVGATRCVRYTRAVPERGIVGIVRVVGEVVTISVPGLWLLVLMLAASSPACQFDDLGLERCDVGADYGPDRECRFGALIDVESGGPTPNVDVVEEDGAEDAVEVDVCDTCTAGELCCPVSSDEEGDTFACVAQSDTRCGSCETACHPTQSCVSSACVCAVGKSDCNEDPSDGCEADLLQDEMACGSCGNSCADGERCVNGRCQCGEGLACPEGESCCGGSCLDVTVRADHCGECGNSCVPNERCVDGTCECTVDVITGSTVTCDQGQRCCPGVGCVDLPLCGCGGVQCESNEICCDNTQCVQVGSRENCGGCGIACREDQVCEGLTCTCAVGERDCGDDGCVDVDSNSAHCGACDNACPATQECCAGSCRPGPVACSWWDPDWPFRMPLTVESDTALDAGYPVMVELDHSALVGATPNAKSRADGNDVRVVRWDPSAMTWTELARVVEPIDDHEWNTSQTRVWFQLDGPLQAAMPDTTYFLYYGNGNASDPGYSGSDVVLLTENFDDSDVDPDVDIHVRNNAEKEFNDGASVFLDENVNNGSDDQSYMVVSRRAVPGDRMFVVSVEVEDRYCENWTNTYPLILTARDNNGVPRFGRSFWRIAGMLDFCNRRLLGEYFQPDGQFRIWGHASGPWMDSELSISGDDMSIVARNDHRRRYDFYSDGSDWWIEITPRDSSDIAPFQTAPVAWTDVARNNLELHPTIGEFSSSSGRAEMAVYGMMIRPWVGADADVTTGTEQNRP